MLRRTGFARKIYVPPPAPPLLRLERRAVTGIPVSGLVVCRKENAIQHAGYMDLVRAMPCERCGHPPRSVFCHSDEGKGQGIKTDCRRGFPLCRACHHLIGSTGKLGRDERRRLEVEYGARTRDRIISARVWPARLPKWEGV